MCTQKNRLIETILSSTHTIGFGWILSEISWVKELYTPPYLDLGLLDAQGCWESITTTDVNAGVGISVLVGTET